MQKRQEHKTESADTAAVKSTAVDSSVRTSAAGSAGKVASAGSTVKASVAGSVTAGKASTDNPAGINTDRDSLLILTVLSAAAIFYYGSRAGIIIALSLVTTFTADFLCASVFKKPRFSGTLPAIVTGLINALILPSSVPFAAVVIGGIVSIVLLRYCFGGVSHEIINPSAGALLFLYYAFPGRLSVYVPIFTDIGLDAVVYPKTTDPSFFYRLINSRVVTGDFFDLLTGRLTSVMGGCVAIALIAGLIYIIRRDFSCIAFFTAAACFFVISFLYTKNVVFACYALAGVLPGIVFTALQPSAHFTGRFYGIEAKAIYGLLLGAVCAMFVWYSRNEYGAFFAAVILSPLAAYFRTHCWDLSRLYPKSRRFKLSRE